MNEDSQEVWAVALCFFCGLAALALGVKALGAESLTSRRSGFVIEDPRPLGIIALVVSMVLLGGTAWYVYSRRKR